MSTSAAVLVCLGLIYLAPMARAQVSPGEGTKVHVSAGDLADGVESLGAQAGVNVLYPGDLLDGRTTRGVDGTLSPTEAFSRLLEGTALAVIKDHGALRIAMAPSPAPAVSRAEPLADSGPVTAIWVERDVRIRCGDCARTSGMHSVLERLGATSIAVKRRSVAFLTLAPPSEGEVAAGLATAAHWRTMRFDPAELSPAILSLFTLRSVREIEGQVAFDVLVADSTLNPPECHRVIQQGKVLRFCGSAEQWNELRVTTGFRCSSRESDIGAFAGSQYARCASAAEWNRVSLAQAKQRPPYEGWAGDGFWLSALGSASPPDNSLVPVSGPLPQTPPPAAH